MKKKDKKQYLLFLEKMETHGMLKTESTKREKEFDDFLNMIFKESKEKGNDDLAKKLMELESRNVQHLSALKKDYFNYGIISEKTNEELSGLDEL